MQREQLPMEKDEPPLKAWEQNFKAIRNPQLGYIPRESVLNAFKKSVKSRLKSTSSVQWESRGPYNVGGRTRAIMFDPNDSNNRKVWAGGVTGGLWYNENIDATKNKWIAVDDFWSNLGVTSISYDPLDTKVFYVGTGEGWWSSNSTGNEGIGIMKSTDGGQSWTHLASSQNFLFINDLIVRKENNESVLYVAVDNLSGQTGELIADQGLYRSTDGGETFTQVLPQIEGENYSPAQIEIGANNRMYVSTKSNPSNKAGGSVFYSDNGTTWVESTLKSDGARVAIACAPSNENYIYALISKSPTSNGCYAMYSDDMGLTWKDATHPEDDFSGFQGVYDLVIAVHPSDHQKIAIGAIDVMISEDGMTSWASINAKMHADYHVIEYFPDDNDKILFGNDGGVYKLSNLWSDSKAVMLNDGYNITQFYTCAIHPEAGENYFLAGSQDNGTEIFNSTGIEITEGATGGDGCFCFISESNPRYQLSSHIGNSFYRSTDGGKRFSRLDGVSAGKFVNPADYDDNKAILYSCGSSFSTKTIHRFKNIKGVTVTADEFEINMKGDPGIGVSHIKVSPYTTESSTIYVGTEIGELLKIENADTENPTSTNLTHSEFPQDAYISCIELGESENELIVCFSNYGVSSIWYTDDGGDSWSEKEGNLPDMPVRWIIQNPTERNKVMLATQFGVWATEDFDSDNPSWNAENSGLANVRIDMLKLRKSDQTVIAATHGRGLYSTNAWETITTGIKDKLEAKNGIELKVYPNPFSDYLKIENKDNLKMDIKLYNIQGKLVKSIVTSEQLIELSTANLSAGIYVLNVSSNESVKSFKVIKS
ncbi:T9SS type A sorting domain-containing protein [Marinifilum sp.]|uniref:T9SS type A sorting domain-containing protein n=1 Tax=Marinifilum sp. TaxID=2033137 RepID=UPI003BAD4533